jgi:hypothetical protein
MRIPHRRKSSFIMRITTFWRNSSDKIHWLTCAIILFSFAMPSGVVGVGNAIGTQGVAMGIATAVVITSSSLIGAMLLLRLWILAPKPNKPRVFGDFGKLATKGMWLSRVGNTIQFVNFILFMPVAIDLVADCLKGVGMSTSCSGLYTLTSAGFCLCLTQVRSLPNASFAAYITGIIILAVVIIQLVEVYRHPIVDQQDESVRWFGNGEIDTSISVVRGALGATACIWAYVPSFLTAELASVMENPKDMHKSLYLSGSLNLFMFVVVGTLIAYAWGWNLSDPLTLTPQWIDMVDGSVSSQAMNSLLLFANLTAYVRVCVHSHTHTHTHTRHQRTGTCWTAFQSRSCLEKFCFQSLKTQMVDFEVYFNFFYPVFRPGYSRLVLR